MAGWPGGGEFGGGGEHERHEGGDCETALEDGAEAVDYLGREMGEGGQGLLADARGLALGLERKDGAFDGSVGPLSTWKDMGGSCGTG